MEVVLGFPFLSTVRQQRLRLGPPANRRLRPLLCENPLLLNLAVLDFVLERWEDQRDHGRAGLHGLVGGYAVIQGPNFRLGHVQGLKFLLSKSSQTFFVILLWHFDATEKFVLNFFVGRVLRFDFSEGWVLAHSFFEEEPALRDVESIGSKQSGDLLLQFVQIT